MSAGIHVTVTQKGNDFNISIVSDAETTPTHQELLVADAINNAVTAVARVSKAIIDATKEGGES